ncbi:sugar phosphate isomerase/epimerase family protein [Paenibacillus koleovorans]|uniref:sugar phosphate isomerase/epimerase family protein n=1 Tax=Paenibacillus koleovorans TaxID=121608 RepID=UPI000FDC1B55|nr:sugar phosphate isomerase/epimerase [Paenibacillus koleovorans]
MNAGKEHFRFRQANDGSGRAPSLQIQQSWWAMTQIGRPGITTEEKFEMIAEAGYDGILSRFPQGADAASWRALLDHHRFSFGVNALFYPHEDNRDFFKQAADLGALYVTGQVMGYYMPEAEQVAYVEQLYEFAERAGVPFFVETHRMCVTQDLLRSVQLVERLAKLQLTIDLSHYAVAGVIVDNEAPHADYFSRLLSRASSIHGRISNGHQVQIDLGPNGEHPLVPLYEEWWANGMRTWLQEAAPGDVFPFVTELGPADYAIRATSGETGLPGDEISDRWQQALLLQQIGRRAWQRANSPS